HRRSRITFSSVLSLSRQVFSAIDRNAVSQKCWAVRAHLDERARSPCARSTQVLVLIPSTRQATHLRPLISAHERWTMRPSPPALTKQLIAGVTLLTISGIFAATRGDARASAANCEVQGVWRRQRIVVNGKSDSTGGEEIKL